MKNSYLIQRLLEPIDGPHRALLGKDNPFAFGGGLKNGGLSDKAMEVLRPIFQFDYMGSAEYEYGAVPKALAEMARNMGNLVKSEVKVPFKKIRVHPWMEHAYKPLPKTGEVTLYVLCQKDHVDHVKELVLGLLGDRVRTKDGTGLPECLMERKDGEVFRGKARGWLELDNGFFFFSDKEMFEKTAALFVG